ncbi:type II secretion system F family protein [Jiella marina]|uniref:type II secretion system F family protein n=1 Tax=Jiella sp. LLJ827 TaxID=2917712 RepID=UPI0021010C25|nr:type II secretion system F family protein [Jiella sp. LLJ827]MCQ0989319.1 type II secretion system F family protein [Jiella sp. LLJ827]
MNGFPFDTELVTQLIAGASVALAIVVVAWPYLGSDRLAARMRQIAEETDGIRRRERAALLDRRDALTRAPPKRLYQLIVKQLNLGAKADDATMARLLQQAGYRGSGQVVKFLAARVISAATMMIAGPLYLSLVAGQPPSIVLVSVIFCGALGYFVPVVAMKNRVQKRQTSIRRAWPEALDLMLICVEAGMSVEAAFRKVSGEIAVQSVELAEELNLTTAELSYLQDRRKALENLGARTDVEGVRAVVTALIQAERYGTPVGQAMRVLAQETRDMRMAEAEKKAAALPPKLTVPMIVFFLPVLFVVILGPVAVQALSQ